MFGGGPPPSLFPVFPRLVLKCCDDDRRSVALEVLGPRPQNVRLVPLQLPSPSLRASASPPRWGPEPGPTTTKCRLHSLAAFLMAARRKKSQRRGSPSPRCASRKMQPSQGSAPRPCSCWSWNAARSCWTTSTLPTSRGRREHSRSDPAGRLRACRSGRDSSGGTAAISVSPTPPGSGGGAAQSPKASTASTNPFRRTTNSTAHPPHQQCQAPRRPWSLVPATRKCLNPVPFLLRESF
mmetsp:Transcript_9185/g.22520  ORF Transcript_9185/g.22520 Transcript_9185/m.22520 type:complete len:238 (+) Transcript_9185:1890-2603(+)